MSKHVDCKLRREDRREGQVQVLFSDTRSIAHRFPRDQIVRISSWPIAIQTKNACKRALARAISMFPLLFMTYGSVAVILLLRAPVLSAIADRQASFVTIGKKAGTLRRG